jgi:predicted RNA-binding protein YlqC (UPF0109 family)
MGSSGGHSGSSPPKKPSSHAAAMGQTLEAEEQLGSNIEKNVATTSDAHVLMSPKKSSGTHSTTSHAVDEMNVHVPSPHGDKIASSSLSADSGGGSVKISVDERLHRWLEEEVMHSNVKHEDGPQKLYVKLLVSNSAAGSVIGKIGMNIHHTQTQTGARVQLSKAYQFFPGTNQRTLLVKGNMSQIASALYLIFVRLIDEDCAPIFFKSGGPEEQQDEEVEERSLQGRKHMDLRERVASAVLQVKVPVPEEYCGIIVGKGGSNIKSLCETTNTTVHLLRSAQEDQMSMLTHKVFSIRGHLVDVLKAITLFALKQSDDPDYQSYGHIPRTYLRTMQPSGGMYGMGHMSMPHMAYGGGMGMAGHAPQSPGGMEPFISIICPLSEEQQKSLMSKINECTSYIYQATGILLKLESTPGHEGFFVRLQGPRDAVLSANMILTNQLFSQTHLKQ